MHLRHLDRPSSTLVPHRAFHACTRADAQRTRLRCAAYNITHFFFDLSLDGGSSAAMMASSNTFFKPFCVKAEHSTYLTALSSRELFSACSTVMGFCLFFASFSMVELSPC